MKNELPNFIGIGAPRCGTTWLYETLRQHPNVYLSEVKELCFFMPQSYRSTTEKGIDWYKSQFNLSKETSVWGEISPRYYFTAGTPEMIHKHIPKVKLIYMLRNPAEMVHSLAYFHSSMYPHSIDPKTYGLHDYLSHHFIEELCQFHKHYKRFRRFFNEDQILVMFHHDIKADPQKELLKITSFLGLPPLHYKEAGEKINQGKFAISFGVANFIGNYKGPFKYRLKNLEQGVNRQSLFKSSSLRNYAFDHSTFDVLKKVYADDVRSLESEFNLDLSQWLEFEGLPEYMKKYETN